MFIAATSALLVTLSGCALLEPAVDEEVLSDVALCTMGHTWSLDTADLAAQLLAELQKNHPDITAVDANGEVTLDWGTDSVVDMASDLTIVVTAGTAEAPVVVTETLAGTGGGRTYINADVAIPRTWANDVEVETTAKNAGVDLEAPPFALPDTVIDDAVGLELTCDGNTLTIHPRGSKVIQKFTTG
jgi:hypothetical protein